MSQTRIEAHKVTKPIQLLAVWFAGLVLLETAFLTAAAGIGSPAWVAPMLAVAAVIFVPLFLGMVFLMQTVFRIQLQEDQYYSDWLKRREQAFAGFQAENLSSPAGQLPATTLGDGCGEPEEERVRRYPQQRGLFLVHTWRPSKALGQVADIVIWLHQHRKGPLSEGQVERVEYYLGPKFSKEPFVKRNTHEAFKLEISAYGPVLCLARVFINGESEPIECERYLDFEEPPPEGETFRDYEVN